MRVINNKRVHFGEFAGPLAHEAAIFDWQLISTQELAAAFDYPFSAILKDDGIPYAPVVVDASVHRYPAIGDVVNVDVDPVAVGESSLDLKYEMTDGDGDPIATVRATHVTIGPDGGALPLPDATRNAYAEARIDDDVDPGPEPVSERLSDGVDADSAAVIESVAERGLSVGEMSGENQPYKPRSWHWEFTAPVPFESELHVNCDVVSVNRDVIRVAQEFSIGDTTNINGVTEYSCFDRAGEPTTFDQTMLDAFR